MARPKPEKPKYCFHKINGRGFESLTATELGGRQGLLPDIFAASSKIVLRG